MIRVAEHALLKLDSLFCGNNDESNVRLETTLECGNCGDSHKDTSHSYPHWVREEIVTIKIDKGISFQKQDACILLYIQQTLKLSYSGMCKKSCVFIGIQSEYYIPTPPITKVLQKYIVK